MGNNDDLLMRLESTGCDKGFPWTTMQEAAATIRKQRAEIERFRSTLESISRSTCCDQCQEAALFARAAMKGEGDE